MSRGGALRAAAAALDPVENISNGRAGDGRYRRQYQEHARTTAWGTERQGCGSGALVRVAGDRLQVMPVLCDRWSCKLCGPKRAAWLKRESQMAMFRYKLRYFWTLTIDTKSCTPTESYALVTAAWNRLRTVLQKHHGKFSYVWVMESTKRGYAHLHLLASVDISHAELSQRWRSATGGSYIVDVQGIASEKAANYLAKYCTQQATTRQELHSGQLAHKHVYGKSHDVQFAPFRPPSSGDGDWYHWRQPYKEAVTLLGDLGRPLVNQQDKTPYAAFAVAPGLDVEAECARLGAEVEAARAAWQDPEPIFDDPLIDDAPDDIDALFVQLNKSAPWPASSERPPSTVQEVPRATATG